MITSLGLLNLFLEMVREDFCTGHRAHLNDGTQNAGAIEKLLVPVERVSVLYRPEKSTLFLRPSDKTRKILFRVSLLTQTKTGAF